MSFLTSKRKAEIHNVVRITFVQCGNILLFYIDIFSQCKGRIWSSPFKYFVDEGSFCYDSCILDVLSEYVTDVKSNLNVKIYILMSLGPLFGAHSSQ